MMTEEMLKKTFGIVDKSQRAAESSDSRADRRGQEDGRPDSVVSAADVRTEKREASAAGQSAKSV